MHFALFFTYYLIDLRKCSSSSFDTSLVMNFVSFFLALIGSLASLIISTSDESYLFLWGDFLNLSLL